MNCRALAEQVDAYLDGDLDDVAASACRGHLRTCAACRALADEHAQVRDAVAGLPLAEPPPGLWARIDAELGKAEIADARRGRVAQAWTRLVAWARPVAWPAALVGSAGAIAILVVHLRTATTADRSLAALAVPAPTAPAVAAPAPAVHLTLRDAVDERADRDAADEQQFRQTAAELLALARGEVATWPAARARRFTREVERREHAVLAAAPGRARARAWHALTAYLEDVALGQQVALGGAP